MWARVDIKMTAQSSSSLRPLFGWINTRLKCLQMWVVVQAVIFSSLLQLHTYYSCWMHTGYWHLHFHCRTTLVHAVSLVSLKSCLRKEGMDIYWVLWVLLIWYSESYIFTVFTSVFLQHWKWVCIHILLQRSEPLSLWGQLRLSESAHWGKLFAHCTMIWHCLCISPLEHGSPTLIYISLRVRSVCTGDFWWKLWPSNAATHRGQPRDRKQERKGNGVTATI